MEFVTSEMAQFAALEHKANLTRKRIRNPAERPVQSSRLSGGPRSMGDIWGQIGSSISTALNAQYPGLGPLINPADYKPAATAATAATTTAASTTTIAGMKIPTWTIPVAIAGTIGMVGITLLLMSGGKRATNPVRRLLPRSSTLQGSFRSSFGRMRRIARRHRI